MRARRWLAGTRLARALLAVPLLAGLLVISQGNGFPVARLTLSGGGAWLASASVGQLSLIDGASAELAAQVKVADPPVELGAVQAGPDAYAIDRSAGTLVRVDGRSHATSPAVSVISGASAGLQAFPGTQTLFVLDRTRGLVASADPVSLGIRQPLSLVASVAEGAGVVDAADRLWLLDQGSGDLVWLDGGVKRSRPRVVADPARAKLVRVEERVALVDLATRTVQVLDPRSGRPTDQGCVDVDPGDPSVQVNGSASTSRVYAASGRRGVLLVSDVERGDCATAVVVSDPGADLGVPQEAAGRVFVPDFSTRRVIIVDPATKRVVASAENLPRGGFELLSKDGVVFYNDPDSERAGVIRLDGSVRTVRKYNPKNPGKGLTLPGGGDGQSTGDRPTPSPVPPPTTPQPEQTARPAIRIQASATRARVGTPIGFRVVAASGRQITSARWSFGDHTTKEGVTVSHAWQRPGTSTVLVQATVRAGAQSVTSATVVITDSTVQHPPPPPGPKPKPKPPPPVPTPKAVVTPSALAFGDVEVGSTKPSSVTISNEGSGPLRIQGIELRGANSTEFITDNACQNKQLDEGQRCPIPVSFTPSGSGVRRAQLVIAHSASDRPASVPLDGTGTSPEPPPEITDIYVSPSSFVTVGESVSFEFRVNGNLTGWLWEILRGGKPVMSSSDSIPFHRFTEPGSYTVKLTASNAGGSATMTEPLTVNPKPADLVPAGYTRGTYRFNITVRNQGDGDAASSRVFVDLPSGFGTDCDLQVSAIPANGSRVVTCSTSNCIDYCSVPFSVRVDSGGAIPESDEGNNVANYVYCVPDPQHPCP